MAHPTAWDAEDLAGAARDFQPNEIQRAAHRQLHCANRRREALLGLPPAHVAARVEADRELQDARLLVEAVSDFDGQHERSRLRAVIDAHGLPMHEGELDALVDELVAVLGGEV